MFYVDRDGEGTKRTGGSEEMKVIPGRTLCTAYIRPSYRDFLLSCLRIFLIPIFAAYYKHIAHIFRMGQKLHHLKQQQIIHYHHK